MSALLELTHATRLSATAAVIDVDHLVIQRLCLVPAVSIALWTTAAWCFLSDQSRRSER